MYNILCSSDQLYLYYFCVNKYKLFIGCLNNEFQCANKCIELIKRCDTIIDCDNEEDEIDCSKYHL